MTSPKGYVQGTHRAVSPEETLAAVEPLRHEHGVTRLADVTGVDRVGIPVYAAIRPRGRATQTCNGKGLRPVDARVSALMEAVELSHAEAPRVFLRHASPEELARRGEMALPLGDVPGFGDAPVEENVLLPWIRGERLGAGEPIWIPGMACAFFPELQNLPMCTNGLASGNTLTEATLHALYEVIQRDILGRLQDASGRVNFSGVGCLSLDDGVPDLVGPLLERCSAAGLEVRLLHVGDHRPLHTFMAVLLDPRPRATSPAVHLGNGTHLSPAIAACRALTAAAQARVVSVQAAGDRDGQAKRRLLYRFFSGFQRDTGWGDLEDGASETFEEDLTRVLAYLEGAGQWPVHRAVLSEESAPFVVAKTIVNKTLIGTLR